ncbi:hypothetical protein R6Q57_028313 [Mikania cordata]
MKFLHSPSSSSSTTEIRPDYAATSCIPAILRRLLCFRSLPTFPLDNHIKESCQSNEIDNLYCANKLRGNPGIFGKLMGLDSMPAGKLIDNCGELKLQKKGNCLVLEAPTFVELENEKFIILSFEGGGKDKELKLHSSKYRKGLVESKGKARNKVNQEMIITQSSMNDNDVMNSCKLSNLGKYSGRSCDSNGVKRGISKKKKHEKAETESDSENSSPVSVLEFSVHQEAEYSGNENLKSKNSNSRRKLSGDLDKNAPSPSSSSSSSSSSSRTSGCNSVDDGEVSCIKGKEYDRLEKKNLVIGDSKEMWEEICKMAERDVMDSSRVQMGRWKGEDVEEIGVFFELQILDQLIVEIFPVT